MPHLIKRTRHPVRKMHVFHGRRHLIGLTSRTSRGQRGGGGGGGEGWGEGVMGTANRLL